MFGCEYEEEAALAAERTDGAESARALARAAERRSAIVAALLIGFVLVGAVAAGFAVDVTYRSNRNDLIRQLEREARTGAAEVDRLLQERTVLLQTIADVVPFSPGVDAESVERLLESIDPSRLGLTGGISWFDADGRTRIATGPGPPAPPGRIGRPDVLGVLQSGRNQVSGGFVDPESGRPTIIVAVPTHDAETAEPTGVLAGAIRLDTIDLIEVAADEGSAAVIDRNGLVISRDGPVAALRSAQLERRVVDASAPGVDTHTRNVAGTGDHVVGYAPVRQLRGTVVVDRAYDASLGPMEARRATALTAIAFVVVGSLLVAFRYFRRLGREARRAQRTTRDLELLAAANSPSSEAVDSLAVLRQACRALVGRVAAYATAFTVTDEDAVLVAVATIDEHQEQELQRFVGMRVPLESDLVHARAARTGEVATADRLDSELVDRLTSDVDATIRRIALRYSSGPTIAVPFSTEGAPGSAPSHVLAAALPTSSRAFHPDDVAVVMELARRCAASIRLLELHAAAESSREQAEALQSLSAALAAVVSVDQLAVAVAEHAAAAAGAEHSNLALPTEHGTLRLTLGPRLDRAMEQRWHEIDREDELPLTDAYRGGEVWVRDRPELESRYPLGAHDARRVDIAALASLPVHDSGGAVVGAVGFAWSSPQPFDPAQQARARAVIAAIEPALDRVRLTEMLNQRRRQAEARARLAAALAATTGIEDTAQVIAEYGPPLLGASGLLVALHEPEADQLVVCTAAGTGGGNAVLRGAISLDESGPLVEAYARGELVVASTREEITARYSERRDLLTEEHLESLAALPLIAGNAVTGAVRVHYDRPGGPERTGAEELYVFAAQAARTLEHARLFELERARHHRLELQQRAAAALATAATLDAVAGAAATFAPEALGACWAGIAFRSDDNVNDLRMIANASGAAPTLSEITDADSLIATVISDGQPIMFDSLERMETADSALYAAMRDADARAFVALPLSDPAFGALVVAFSNSEDAAGDRRTEVQTYRRLCEQAFARARRFDVEHEIASVLQRSLLPGDLDEIPAVPVRVRYHAGGRGTIVGGDWYDVIDVGQGRVALVVGDVVGSGARAAAAMGQLRIAVRTLAPFFGPAELLEQLDALVERLPDARFATVAYVLADTAARTLVWSLAGHPPPLFVSDDAVEFADTGRGAPLGVRPGATRPESQRSLDGVSRALLYTDGLVERRGEPIDDRLNRLATVVASSPITDDHVCDAIIATMLGDETPADDIAIIFADFPSEPVLDLVVPGRIDQLSRLRHQLRGWLERLGTPEQVRTDILLAAGEVCANSVEHGYRSRPGTVRLRARRTDDVINIEIQDSGDWRVPRQDPRRGRGLPIVHKMMDHVDVRRHRSGTTVSMRKSFAAIPALDGPPAAF